jgi:hypothetical protein
MQIIECPPNRRNSNRDFARIDCPLVDEAAEADLGCCTQRRGDEEIIDGQRVGSLHRHFFIVGVQTQAGRYLMA